MNNYGEQYAPPSILIERGDGWIKKTIGSYSTVIYPKTFKLTDAEIDLWCSTR